MTKAPVTTGAGISAVAVAVAVAATAVTTAFRFSLRQIAGHSFLPPAATATTTTPASAVLPFAVILGQGQVQRQGEGQAGLLLHQRRYLIRREHGNALEVEAAQ